MDQEYVTSGEFGRFRSDFSAYQGREAALLEAMEGRIVSHIDARVDGVDARLDLLNGQTKRNSEAVAVHAEKIAGIETRGCGQLAAHRALAWPQSTDSPDGATSRPWHRDRRTYAGGGLAMAGVAALYSLVRLFEALAAAAAQHVDKIGPVVK